MAQWRCPFMAQMRSRDLLRTRPMLVVDRTYVRHRETDANDPERTWCNGLLNHLVGADEHGRRNGDPKCASGREIDDEPKRCQFYRQITWRSAA